MLFGTALEFGGRVEVAQPLDARAQNGYALVEAGAGAGAGGGLALALCGRLATVLLEEVGDVLLDEIIFVILSKHKRKLTVQ